MSESQFANFKWASWGLRGNCSGIWRGLQTERTQTRHPGCTTSCKVGLLSSELATELQRLLKFCRHFLVKECPTNAAEVNCLPSVVCWLLASHRSVSWLIMILFCPSHLLVTEQAFSALTSKLSRLQKQCYHCCGILITAFMEPPL